MTQEDIPQLEALKSVAWIAADKEHYGENQPNFYQKEFTLIARQDRAIIGYITVKIDTGVAQIEPLMVNPERKGQGIGTKLLLKAEEKAYALGAHKVWLETGQDWQAKGFYEKHGYVIRTTLPKHHGEREFVLMDKFLN